MLPRWQRFTSRFGHRLSTWVKRYPQAVNNGDGSGRIVESIGSKQFVAVGNFRKSF